MKESAEIFTGVLILLGTVFSLLSAVGMVRLPDVYNRAHAASKSATLAVLCILIGTLLYFLLIDGFLSIRLILGIFFVFLTAPVSAHVVSRSAYRAKVPLSEASIEDELENYFKANKTMDDRRE